MRGEVLLGGFVAFKPTAAPALSDWHVYRTALNLIDGSMTLSFDASQGRIQAHSKAR
jgi:hypothetical protein